MSELKTFRVPVPVVIALAVMVLACAETDDYDDSYYYDSGSSCSGTCNGCGSGPGTTPDYTAPAQAAPSRPTLPAYIPELDKSTPPDYPKTADVSIQHGRPDYPAEDAGQFWERLMSKYEVNTEGSWTRGDGTNPYFEPAFRLGDHTLLLVAEQRSDGVRRYAHGLAFATFNANRQYETYSAGQRWATSDPYTYGVGFFRDGKMHGPWAFNYPGPAQAGQANKLHYICEYQDGKAGGEARWWDEDGYLTRHEFYQDGKLHGTVTRWDDDGIVQSEYVAGIQYGLYRKWNYAGQLIERAQVYDDQKYGKSEYWVPGGTFPYVLRYYNFGPNTGWKSCYDAQGKLHYQAWVENGIESGPYVQYDPAGFKVWEGSRLEGRNEGRFTGYDAQGRVVAVNTYRGGVLHGDYIRYDADGNVTVHDVYDNGSWLRSELAPTWPAPIEVTDADGKPITRKYGRWRVEQQDDMPPMEYAMAMAWHGGLDGCVMFGGRGRSGEQAVLFGQTWLRKQGSWLRLFEDLDGPPPREYAALAWDSARGVVVMFGGRSAEGGALGDTWELGVDGWKQRSSGGPAGRWAGSLVYDPQRALCVLVGGKRVDDAGVEETRSDTWEWNGTGWTAAAEGPAVHGAAACYDEQRGCLVLAGGVRGGGESAETWVLEGGRWRRSGIYLSTAQSMHAMVYDPDARSVVLLGKSGTEPDSGLLAQRPSTYLFASSWLASRYDHNPPARRDFAAAYDLTAREIVLYGGRRRGGNDAPFRETLLLTDETAADRAADNQDFIREKLSAPGWAHIDNGEFAQEDATGWAIARDPGRAVTVMFGGGNLSGVSAVTREFKDGKWRLLSPAVSPPARTRASCWYDEARGRVMLYGGSNLEAGFDDLWEWDGVNWQRLREHVPGAPKSLSTSAYDARRGVLVAIVEKEEGPELHEFNGTSWKRIEVELPSPGYSYARLVYDPVKQQVLYYGGMDVETFEVAPDAWHWDGKYWAESKPVTEGIEDSMIYELHSDPVGKALWQISSDAIRRFDGKSWQAWVRPEGLNGSEGALWMDPAGGRLYFHGTRRTYFMARNDTLVFDPEQGEKIE
ncbi:MAG: hypothetical protein M5U25_01350 [Planctomycetota bacterium]|nr:hypothetical protein [Planctomycetota bacterium]